ncbi:MAG: PIN domain-containing protein [bacterium]|nr:PIN domain-containing protein [bacterium]
MPGLSVIVNADVIDIGTDTPHNSDKFLVDSNVWYWMTYTRSNLGSSSRAPRPYQTTTYPNYVKSALSVNAEIFKCGLSLSEIGNRIESNEHDIFRKSSSQDLTMKEFRHNHVTERANVVGEIELAWLQIEQYASRSLEVFVTDVAIGNSLNLIKSTQLDVYDLLMADAMLQSGITSIITDDSDFVTVRGIKVFTANRTAISEARRQNKLLIR